VLRLSVLEGDQLVARIPTNRTSRDTSEVFHFDSAGIAMLQSASC